MSSLRSQRAQRRAAQVRNQRIIILVGVVIIVGVIGFLAWNAIRTTSQPAATAPTAAAKPASGLQITDSKVGSGAEAKAGTTISVNYTGYLQDGTKFDSSVDPKFQHVQPLTFKLGAGRVIPGWEQGLAGMKVGGQRKLVIPPDLAYGSQGFGGSIPPNATLTFEVELLDVK
jgi:FKBP-type peptidyl-prolyl cis-trans isomerase